MEEAQARVAKAFFTPPVISNHGVFGDGKGFDEISLPLNPFKYFFHGV
jgi:hypothetical protein